ncbi:MAG: CvfB family protein [Sarcina sp.]
MVNIGQFNNLKVSRDCDFGYFLDSGTGKTKDDILLPKRELKGKTFEIGEEVRVFIYRDSSDRLISTMREPLAEVGDLALLKVAANSPIGAFLDMGLEKDILVPKKEMLYKMEEGVSYLVYIYIDKTGRLAATTDVDRYLDYMEEPEKMETVSGIVYGFQTNKSLSVAIDNKYKATVLNTEYFTDIKVGDTVTGKISRIYEDGMIRIQLRETRLTEKEILEEKILEYLKANGNEMSFNDKSPAEDIKATFNCSKNYFKMALGGLMKRKVITQDKEGTKLI